MRLQLFITRKESRKTQKDMAAILFIHRHTYHEKESGKADFTLTEAIKLSQYFNKSLDTLFKEEVTAK